MRSLGSSIDPELGALLERGKVIGPVPDAVRARSLARARAAMLAETAHERVPVRRRGLVIALAASIALLVAAAGAVAALRSFSPARREPALPAGPAMVASARVPELGSPPEQAAPSPQGNLAENQQRVRRSAVGQESYAAELRLLQRAQVAYAGRDYADVLALVAEHRRRFPNGRLAEEREALRVRALASAGRTEEARRAADGFRSRFPRSVFLPQLGE